MWIPVSTIAAICVLLEVSFAGRPNNDLEIMFKDRSDSEWEEVWHKEKHARCRENLVRHLYWACEKDIYRLTRRSDQTVDSDGVSTENTDDYLEFPWLEETKAKRFLRFRRGANRRAGSSITAECCKSTGCTWEEYAEYCPTNKRYHSYV